MSNILVRFFDKSYGKYTVSLEHSESNSTVIIQFSPSDEISNNELEGVMIGKIFKLSSETELGLHNNKNYIPLDVLEYAILIAKDNL